MKPIIAFFFILNHYGCFSQSNVETDTALNTSTVFFFRRFQPKQKEIRVNNYPVFINDSLVGRLGKNRYLVVKITPGNKIIAPQMNGKKQRKRARKFNVMMEAGDTRYYELIEPLFPFSFHLTVLEASKKFGEEQMEHLMQQKK